MKIFMYVVANEQSAQISPVQMVMAPDLGTAKEKLLEELKIVAEDLWIMEFTKGN